MAGRRSTRKTAKPAASRPSGTTRTSRSARTAVSGARDGAGRAALAEALEQQAATGEILRVISRSRTDAQPVFDLIAQRAGKLCGAEVAVVSRFDGTVIQLAAIHGVVPEAVKIVRALYPMQLEAKTVTARVIRGRQVVHIADVLADRRYGIKEFARAAHYRAGLGVPIFRDRTVIGSIFVGRTIPGLFTETQVELLKTFSEQTAIAIQNVRLFEELRRSEERYALATSAAVEGIYEWDVEGGKLFLTERAKAFFSLQGAELTPAAWNMRIHADDYRGYRAAIIEHFKGGTTHLEHEYRIADDGGGYRWVLDRGIGIRNPDGRVTKLVGALSDITQRKRTEIELRRARDEAEEALEQQTATAEILRAISSSPGNLQPVLETLVHAAARFCGAPDVVIVRPDGGVLRVAAALGTFADVLAREAGSIEAVEIPLGRGSVSGRAFLDRRMIHVHDLGAEAEDEYPDGRALQRRFGHRTMVAAPLLREGVAIGVIGLCRFEVKPFSERQLQLLRLFADQAVIAIENVRLFHALEVKNRDLTEALEQQTATSEILRVISRSPTDVQPVFDTIVQSAVRLCGADHSIAARFDGEFLHPLAHHGFSPEALEVLARMFPTRPGRQSLLQRVALTGTVVNIPDMLEDPDYSHDYALAGGWRSGIAVPMLRDGKLIGGIAVAGKEPRAFSDRLVALLQTFADQAVIAIENVRLFNELGVRNRDLGEALEQQTATSEILRVISRSPTDVQPVFDTIAAAAVKLCGARFAFVTSFDGEWIHMRATVGPGAEAHRLGYPMRPGPSTIAARVIRDRATVQIEDMLADREYAHKEAAARQGFRSGVGVPMMRDGQVLGCIAVTRPEPGALPESLVRLLQTFADQAVIAIENVRLFTELERRNRDLTEALEQQTATSEILRVISRSPTNVQPVFDTIARAALKLCGASSALVTTYDGKLIHIAAGANLTAEGADAWGRVFPRPPSRETAIARAVLTRQLAIIPDVLEDSEYRVGDTAVGTGFRSSLAVPLLRDGNPIGAIGVGRPEPGPLPEKQIALLQTFADQAVIAIENVRLFTELEARNHDLTETLEQQTVTSKILRVISQSPTDPRPVFDTIAAAAMELCGGNYATVVRYDGELVDIVAFASGWTAEEVAAIRKFYPRPPGRDTVASRAVLSCGVVAIPDVQQDSDYAIRDVARSAGYRSAVGVPLVHQGKPIGAIGVGRAEVGLFPDKQVALLQTFADQAVIAIENVRLFKELETRNRELTEALGQQTATSEILSVMSKSQTDVQPVFDTIVRSVVRLCGGWSSALYRWDGASLHNVALSNPSEEDRAEFARLFPMEVPGGESPIGRVVMEGKILHLADALTDAELPEFGRNLARQRGYRAMLLVPMLRDGSVVGVIGVSRAEPGLFPDAQVKLVRTFAAQAVIAIENVRLFKELETRNRELTEALEHQTATSEILRVISSSPTDAQPVFDIISARAMKLCDAQSSVVSRVEGGLIHLAAASGVTEEAKESIARVFPIPLGSTDSLTGRTVHARSIVHVEDVLADPTYETKDAAIVAAVAGGWRNGLSVPMIREGQVIGTIFVGRPGPGRFANSKVELLKTFADQAVIAIENVRLFKELEARTTQLTRSVEELKALGDVGQAVSSTLDLDTVLRTIVARATQLAGVDGGSIFEYDAAREEFHARATDGLPEELVGAMRATPIRKGEGVLGRMAITREPVAIPDIADTRAYQSGVREKLVKLGYRSLLAVPLLREDHLLGGLAVNRKRAGEFTPEVIGLLKTFATQSALAIQNARLFREIESKSRELETASRHKSEFLANMSHELRTPLNAIIGFSEVLAERMFGEINDKQAEYLADILESGRHLLSLINDILDLSKIEAGRMELEPSEFDLPGAIENTLILVRERAQRRAIRLGRTLDERLGRIRADERKVKQVLLNLLSNALKFTPEGGRIDVRARLSDGVAEISVSDTGVGIAPEDQEAVFEEFRQVGTASKKTEGTGLGLAISRKFVELHGGRMWVESEVGKGSTFTFTLPHNGGLV
jgi:PAS domain S-box-containing protein